MLSPLGSPRFTPDHSSAHVQSWPWQRIHRPSWQVLSSARDDPVTEIPLTRQLGQFRVGGNNRCRLRPMGSI